MPIQKITKEEIVLKSLELFRKRGYHTTSMSDLAEACGLFKGSFYHYFSSKEALGKEVLVWIRDFLRSHVWSVVNREELTAAEHMQKILSKLGKMLLRSDGGCIVGNMTLETAKLVPEFQEVLREIFQDWLQAMTQIYQTKYQPEYASKLARQTVMEFEGAVMLVNLFGQPDWYRDCYERALARLA
jgi:TetR/AcrR family transcriptional repressor of nem operon